MPVDAIRPRALSGTTTQGPLGTSSTSYGYNVSGDVISRDLPTGDQTLTWNENKRLDTVTTTAGTTSYVCDADGTQLIRRDPATTTLYLPTQDIVRDNTTGTLKGTRYYTHNGATVAMRVGGGNPQYLQNDQHGTAQVAVTTPAPGTSEFAATRRTFDPYGNPIGTGHSLWPDDRGFLNKPHNPVTGLTDIGARKYDPTTGTFISVDPVLDTQNPQQWNPYAYSNNNPITFSDPSGLYSDGIDFQNHQMGIDDAPQVGVDCPPCTNDPNQAQEDYEVRTGQNTDPKKQPWFGGRRIPTFEELKNRPGYAHYMVSGEYKDAIKDWAQGICGRAVPEDQDFCSAASAYGLLEVSAGAKQMALIIGMGIVLAPMIAECLASALCPRIVGGAADAISPEGAAFASAASGSAGAARLIDDVLSEAKGSLTIAGTGFSRSEMTVAQHLADQGKTVVLREATGAGRMSDLLVDNVPYDVYTPKEGTSVTNILGRTAKKHSQVNGGGVVVDLTGTSLKASDFGNALARVNGMINSWGGTPMSDVVLYGG